jgi:hypothetical protein
VLWENEREIPAAENLANVLASLAPSLASDAEVDKHGGVEMKFGQPGRSVPKVRVLAASWASYFDQLMRSMLEVS